MVKELLLCAACLGSLNELASAPVETNHQTISLEYPRLILASQSEIRKKAMKLLNAPYECIPAHINEKAIRHSDPLTMVLMISEAKAREIAKREEGIIIAGDLFLVLNGKILEKPESIEEAYLMLQALSGNKHTIVTGLAVYDTETKKMRSKTSTCDIYFRDLSQKEIVAYCNRYPVLKFAGAHESDGVTLFADRIEGSHVSETAISMKDLIQFLNEIELDRI